MQRIVGSTVIAVLAFAGLYCTPTRAAPWGPPTGPINPMYNPGWNMVGGPAGSTLPTATAVYTFANGAYIPAGREMPAGCAGYWAFFPALTAASLNISEATYAAVQSRQPVTCGLQAGWNLIRNPYVDVVQIPAGVTAFYWLTSESRYEATDLMRVGASVWIYSSVAGSITLTPV